MEDLFAKVSDGAISDQEKIIFLISKVNEKTFKEMRNERVFWSQTEDYEELKVALQQKSTEEWADKHMSSTKGGRQLLALDDMSVDQNVPQGQKENHQKHTFRGRGKGKGDHPRPPPKRSFSRKEGHQNDENKK